MVASHFSNNFKNSIYSLIEKKILGLKDLGQNYNKDDILFTKVLFIGYVLNNHELFNNEVKEKVNNILDEIFDREFRFFHNDKDYSDLIHLKDKYDEKKLTLIKTLFNAINTEDANYDNLENSINKAKDQIKTMHDTQTKDKQDDEIKTKINDYIEKLGKKHNDNKETFKTELNNVKENVVKNVEEILKIKETIKDISSDADYASAKQKYEEFINDKKYNICMPVIWKIFNDSSIEKFTDTELFNFIKNIYNTFEQQKNDANDFVNNYKILDITAEENLLTTVFQKQITEQLIVINIENKIEDYLNFTHTFLSFLNEFYVINCAIIDNDVFTDINKYFRAAIFNVYNIITDIDMFNLYSYVYYGIFKIQFNNNLKDSDDEIEEIKVKKNFKEISGISEIKKQTISEICNKCIFGLDLIGRQISKFANYRNYKFVDIKRVKPTTQINNKILENIVVSNLNNPQVNSMPPIFQEFSKYGGFYGGALSEITGEEFYEVIERIKQNYGIKAFNKNAQVMSQIQNMIDIHNKYIKIMNDIIKEINALEEKYNKKIQRGGSVQMGGEDSRDLMNKLKTYQNLNTKRHMLESNIIEKFNSLY